jgi:hypothetical protein
MTASLAAFQRDFAAALTGGDGGPLAAALAGQPAFAVYRNTVAAACVEALAANYPTVLAIVGDPCFRDAARSFALQSPPHDPRLAGYGEGFAEFLAGFEPVRELSYLPAVARLDRFWTETHLAAAAPVLDVAALTALAPAELASAVLVPHPAARWEMFEAMPAYAIWRRHREGLPLDDELPWRGDGGLLARPGDAVAWRELGAPGAAFMDACAQGLRFAEAVEAAVAASTDADPAGLDALRGLVAAGAFTRIEQPA